MLVFLTPLIVAYEIGAWFFLMREGADSGWTISAQRMLSSVFETFGVVGLHLPAVLLTVVLLCWHILQRAKWRASPSVLLGMTIEAIAWAIPLILLAALLAPRVAAAVTGSGSGDDLTSLSWPARATISIGAGLYEEMLFRMIAIAAVHFVMVDLLKRQHQTGLAVGVVVSALLFAAYHTIPSISVGVFYVLAGLYFGVLYVTRGFGIVVGCHAAYDMVALVLGPAAVATAAVPGGAS